MAMFDSAVTALGLGGDALANQVAGETEEERKKRLQLQAQQKMMGSLPMTAVTSLGLGPRGMTGGY